MSTEAASIEDMIDGHADAPAPAEAVTPTPAPAPEPTGETSAAPPAADQMNVDDTAPTVPRRALEDERRKRQEYEKKATELEQWIRQQQQAPPQPQPQPEAPDIYSDPEGALRHSAERQQAVFQREIFNTRVALGQEVMRMRHTDYDEVEQVFIKAAESAPHLIHAMAESANPAQYAYQTGRRLKIMMEVGDDPEAWYQRRREAENQSAGNPSPASSPAPARQAAPLPKSLASTPSATPRDARGQFTERASIEELLG